MTMPKVYEQFDAAFRQVQGYAIFLGADPVGRVCIKYPKDGAGRLYAYVQVWGATMVRSHAGGYGYDKESAAVARAVQALENKTARGEPLPGLNADVLADFKRIKDAGHRWADELRRMGYTVQNVFG